MKTAEQWAEEFCGQHGLTPSYLKGVMRYAFKEAMNEARKQAFEEAAQHCHEYADNCCLHGAVNTDPHKALEQGARECAAAIRKLAEQGK